MRGKENKSRNELKRLNRLAYIKMIAIFGFVVAVIAFSSIAWFTMSREVEGSGMQMEADKLPYELKVEGANTENAGLLTFLNKALFGEDYADGDEKYQSLFQTTATDNKIIWTKTGNTESDGHYVDGLEPGASGKLEFYVVAKEAGTYDPKFKFNIRGFHATTEPIVDEIGGTRVTGLYEINDGFDESVDSELTSSLVSKKKMALTYAQGHILFFRNYDPATHYYSGFIGSDVLEFSSLADYQGAGGTTFTKNQQKKVTVYWKWALTLEQMTETNSNYSPLFSSSNTDDRTKMTTYLQPSADAIGNNQNSIFYNMTNTQVSTAFSTLLNGTDAQIDEAKNTLSIAYNNADQEIGDMIHYILIEMTTVVN